MQDRFLTIDILPRWINAYNDKTSSYRKLINSLTTYPQFFIGSTINYSIIPSWFGTTDQEKFIYYTNYGKSDQPVRIEYNGDTVRSVDNGETALSAKDLCYTFKFNELHLYNLHYVNALATALNFELDLSSFNSTEPISTDSPIILYNTYGDPIKYTYSNLSTGYILRVQYDGPYTVRYISQNSINALSSGGIVTIDDISYNISRIRIDNYWDYLANLYGLNRRDIDSNYKLKRGIQALSFATKTDAMISSHLGCADIVYWNTYNNNTTLSLSGSGYNLVEYFDDIKDNYFIEEGEVSNRRESRNKSTPPVGTAVR